MQKISQQVKDDIIEYFQKQNKFKIITNKFNAAKKSFYSKMDNLFFDSSDDFVYVETLDNLIKVKRVQKVDIQFDADELEKVLQKEVSKLVINKSYSIINIDKLIIYLKSCGVDPKVFKSFLSVTKSVDMKMLEQLESVGKVHHDEIKDCYVVTKGEPYYKVSSERTKGGND